VEETGTTSAANMSANGNAKAKLTVKVSIIFLK
jgi:hypothetical protein